MIFQTLRLQTRPLLESDFEGFFELHGNPKVMRYTTQPSQSEAEARADLKRIMQKTQMEPNYNVWALEDRANGAFVGNCAVMVEEVEGKMWGEVGYRILERKWGNGYGKETGRGLVTHMRDEMGLDGARGYTAKVNVGSKRILEGLGMVQFKEVWDEKFGWWEVEYRLLF